MIRPINPVTKPERAPMLLVEIPHETFYELDTVYKENELLKVTNEATTLLYSTLLFAIKSNMHVTIDDDYAVTVDGVALEQLAAEMEERHDNNTSNPN
jgi:hypothetical protein